MEAWLTGLYAMNQETWVLVPSCLFSVLDFSTSNMQETYKKFITKILKFSAIYKHYIFKLNTLPWLGEKLSGNIVNDRKLTR